jgi:hypothetical protein
MDGQALVRQRPPRAAHPQMVRAQLTAVPRRIPREATPPPAVLLFRLLVLYAIVLSAVWAFLISPD